MLTETGKVFSWGANRRGQLGHSNFRDSGTPRPIESFHRKVAAVAAGAHHTVALMEGGLVFSWGAGMQLGRGVFQGSGDCADPMVVKAISKVATVPLDVHLMISDPVQYAEAFAKAGAHVLTFHWEVAPSVEESRAVIRAFREAGVQKVGISINPDTSQEPPHPSHTL